MSAPFATIHLVNSPIELALLARRVLNFRNQNPESSEEDLRRAIYDAAGQCGLAVVEEGTVEVAGIDVVIRDWKFDLREKLM